MEDNDMMMVVAESKDVSIKSRIGDIVADRGGNRTKLADEIGISPAYLASVINSLDKNVTSKLLKAFATIGINLNWLLTGVGTMYLVKDDLRERAENAEARIKTLEDDLDFANKLAKELKSMILNGVK